MAPVILVLVLLMPAALGSSATSTQCLNATLPDILDIGKCLGSSLNLCKATTTDIVAALVKLLKCLIEALLKLDALSALAALLELVDFILSLIGLDLVKLSQLLKPLCCVSNVPGCKKIFKGTETCKTPIPITLPGQLNVGKCFTDALLLCKEGDPCKDEVLVSLVKALVCLLRVLLGTNPGNLLSGLLCAVVSLLEGVAATATIAIKAACTTLVLAIKLQVKCG
ncbi:uncharacterized protein LOC144100349 [Amblyomma americanum]